MTSPEHNDEELLKLAEEDGKKLAQWQRDGKTPEGWKRTKYKGPEHSERPLWAINQYASRERREKAFWARTKKLDNGCIVWTGPINKDGYGQTSFKGKAVRAHRLAYIFKRGEIPEGALVCHSCDNRPCVNPDHLWIGDIQKNKQDSVNKGRQLKGSQMVFSKLNEEQVMEIRQIAYRKGVLNNSKSFNWGLKKLAKKYGMSVSSLNRAVKGNTWKHVPMPPYTSEALEAGRKLLGEK